MDTLAENIITKQKANLELSVSNSTLPCYFSPENKDSKTGIVCLQEWWGMNVSICKTADNFAQEGFRVIVPDLYRGKVADSRESAGHHMGGLDWTGAIADIAACSDYLREQGCDRVAVIGFCMGGALVIAAACSGVKMDSGVQFYGVPDMKTFDAANIPCPVLGIFGEKDSLAGFSDPEAAKGFAALMEEKGKSFKLSTYPADHAFMNRDSANFDADSYEKALKEAVSFINDN